MYDYRFAGNARCFLGGPQTGKTTQLIEELRALAGKGGSTLVCCATQHMADAFKMQAAAAGIDIDNNIEFATAAHVATLIIATPQAQEVTGRKSHVLCEYEERVLLEDMRTSSMKGKRLKEMLGFFYRQFSELHTPEEWDSTVEEEYILNLLRSNLDFTGGVLRYELAGVALQALEGSLDLKERFSWDNVIVDDYALLSRGMQILVAALATKQLVIASDVLGARTAPLPFPYLEGIQELIDANPAAHVTQLTKSNQPAQIVDALGHLRADASIAPERSLIIDGAQAREDALTLHVADDMGGELRVIAQSVTEAQERDESIAVVGTNNIWRSNVVHALEQLEIAVQLPSKKVSVKDFGDERQAARVRKNALEQLRANPRDGVAWRSIFAAGDYVARSVGITQLKELAHTLGAGMLDTLDSIACGKIELDEEHKALQEVADIYKQTLAELDASASKGVKSTSDSKDAAQNSSAVLVCRPEELFGMHVDHIVFGGFVDGLIPKRDYFDTAKVVGARKERMRAQDVETVHLVLSRACKSIAFTAFAQASLPVAERLGLRIDRIRFKEGMRVCSLHPSSLCADMGIAPQEDNE